MNATSVRRTAAKARDATPRLSLAVQYAAADTDLPARPTLRRWVTAALDRPAAVTLRFVDEAEGLELNRRFRDRTYATNVLTFVYSGHLPGEPLLGDIVVCAPVVRRESQANDRPLRSHFAHLVIHAVLHLQGYDHEQDRDAERMEMRESAILGNLGFPDPYAA